MSKPYTVLCYPNGPSVAKSLIIAEFGGIRDLIDYPPFTMGVDNKTEHYLKEVNPTGQVPALKTPDGYLFESNAMALYFARKVGRGMAGNTDFEYGKVLNWIDFTSNWFVKPLATWAYPYMGYGVYDAAKEQEAKDSLKGPKGKSPLTIMDAHLAKNEFLVGNNVTAADVIAFCVLLPLFTKVGSPAYMADLPHLAKWGKKLAAMPEFKKGLYGRDINAEWATTEPVLPTKN